MKVIGIDPGPIPGILALGWADPHYPINVAVVQCSVELAPSIVELLAGPNTVIAMEAFVNGPRAVRSRTPAAGKATRDLLVRLDDVLNVQPVYHQTAAHVMPWADDRRLAAAGLLEPTKGMRHARSAARHALYAAVQSCGLPDPLSKRTR